LQTIINLYVKMHILLTASISYEKCLKKQPKINTRKDTVVETVTDFTYYLT